MEIMNKKDKFTNPLNGDLTFKSVRPLDLNNLTKKDVKDYLKNTYNAYETLFSSLKYDFVYYLCPDRLRLPLIFYYGHTSAVYVNKMAIAGLIKPSERVNLEFETTFETGVDEMSWDDTEHYRMGGDYRWPSVVEVKEFRKKVKNLLLEVIDRTPLSLPVKYDDPFWAIVMGFEHERIHYETSTVLMRQYPIEFVQRPNGWPYGPLRLNKTAEAIENTLIKVPKTNVRLGKSFDFNTYGWDNEYGRVDCSVSAFEASKFKVTNEQFMEFVLADGYKTHKYWSKEGWDWVQYRQAKHPLFWVCALQCKSGCGSALASYTHCQERHFNNDQIALFENPTYCSNKQQKCGFRTGDESFSKMSILDENGNSFSNPLPFKFRLMFDVVDMPLNWPVECNYHEAKAFCAWKGEDFRVLTEAEHHAIREHEIFEDLNPANDIIYNPKNKVNHNMLYGSSTPVDMFPANSKGFHDVFGNVWEWTEDNFNGLPGHKTSYMYDDFSTPCYDGRHNLIMGGSWVATGDEASHFARFMFRRHFYQHCGFRLARSLPTDDGSKPDPQVRLVADRVFVLGAGFPEQEKNLDSEKLVVSYYNTVNEQYRYDSHLHPELFDNEVLSYHDKEKSAWYGIFLSTVNQLLNQYRVKLDIATHVGCSLGLVAFELTKNFDQVVGIDFCGRFLDVAINLQTTGKLDVKLESRNGQIVKLDITDNLNVCKAVFKQMTWVTNEIPKSDLVLFTMIDRVMNPLSWLKRFKEIVLPDGGLLIIYSENSEWNGSKLAEIIGKQFDMLLQTTISQKDALTVWKIKENYQSFL